MGGRGRGREGSSEADTGVFKWGYVSPVLFLCDYLQGSLIDKQKKATLLEFILVSAPCEKIPPLESKRKEMKEESGRKGREGGKEGGEEGEGKQREGGREGRV